MDLDQKGWRPGLELLLESRCTGVTWVPLTVCWNWIHFPCRGWERDQLQHCGEELRSNRVKCCGSLGDESIHTAFVQMGGVFVRDMLTCETGESNPLQLFKIFFKIWIITAQTCVRFKWKTPPIGISHVNLKTPAVMCIKPLTWSVAGVNPWASSTNDVTAQCL